MKNIQLPKLLSTICILTLLIHLYGCSTETIILSALPETTLPSCQHLPKGKLSTGESCYADILATEFENLTGLKIEEGQEYSITVRGDQVWFDKTRRNKPLCGEPGSFLMNSLLLFKDKRSKDSLWFSLIAEIKGEDKPYDLCPKSEKTTTGSFIATDSGLLVLYANDIEGFYDNNQGEIRVEIVRMN